MLLLGLKQEAFLSVFKNLLEPVVDTDHRHIFKGNLSNNLTWEFDYSFISRRRLGRSYIEQTSFDSDGRNGDFFNPVEIEGHTMVIFEDYGPGVLERLLVYHRTNFARDMDNITFHVDGLLLFNSSVVENVPKKTYPFRQPFLRPNNIYNTAGYFLAFPIAYQQFLRITVHWQRGAVLDRMKIWNATEKCKRERRSCPLLIYYSATCNKLVHGTKLKTTFNDYFHKKADSLDNVSAAVAEMAKEPQVYGPTMRSGCKLTCKKVLPGRELVIFSLQNASSVIQSMLFRIYDIKKTKPVISKNWRTMLITMTWDDREPQVKEIPMAGLFTSGLDYLRNANSLTAGMKKRMCDLNGDQSSDMASYDWLAYLFYEMPFWKSAKITVKRPQGYDPAIICSKVAAKRLNLESYNPHLTGYFSAQLNQQGFDYTQHKNILNLEKQWGHVVAINFFLRNDKIASTHELDVIIETDEANAPVFSGTGLEDFFDYIHDFGAFRNLTSIFQGSPFYVRRRRFRILRCYRHMLLDPILFTTGIRIYLEGFSDRTAGRTRRKFLESSSSFNQTILPDSLFTVVMFYGSKGEGGITTDELYYGQTREKVSSKVHYSPPKVRTFAIRTCFENQPALFFTRTVVSLEPQQKVTHKLRILEKNVGVILRREYRSVVPNQKAKVKVDGRDAGLWFCPQRALTEKHSLRISDYHISAQLTMGKDSIELVLEPVTQWESTSLKVVSLMLTD